MAGGEAARKSEELADEAVEERQPDKREHGYEKERGELRGACREASVTLDFVGAVALIHHAKKHQQSTTGDGFTEDVKDGAVEAIDGEGVDTQGAEAEARDGCKGEQALQVVLNECDQGAIEYAEDGEHDHPVGDATGLKGKEAEMETDQRVEAELAGYNHRHGGGRFAED